jgi:apolipoprotein N-acyltransferase
VLLSVGVAVTSDQGRARNAVLTFRPDRSPPATYSKHHLIPGLEDQYTPGRDYVTIDGGTRTGLAICKDLDFQDIGRAYASLNTQLLLVPAWDFDVDGWLHSRMAVLRGVESGIAIARAARRGRLTLSDDRGRVVAEASAEARDAELVGDLPVHNTRTRYAQWGDWFAWLNIAGLIVLVVLPPRGSQRLVHPLS